MKKKRLYLLLSIGISLTACDPMSFGDYRMEEYSGVLEWREITPKAAWSNRYDHAAAAFDGKLWLAGGYDSGRLKGDSYLEDVWSSEDGKEWILETENAPWKGRRGHTLTAFNDGQGEALYLIGGFEVDEESGFRQYTNDVWKSVNGRDWVQIRERTYQPGDRDTDFLPRFNHVCLNVRLEGQNYLLLIGGATMIEESTGTFAFHYLDDVWRSADGISWEKLSEGVLGQRSEHSACVDRVSGRIYVHGGLFGYTFDNSGMHDQPGEHFNEVWYSDDGINWDYEAVDTLARAGHALVYFEEAIWMLPGKTESNHLRFADGNLFYTYVKEAGGEWILDSRGSAFNARHSYATVLFDERMWVLGGETADNGPDNDVWAASY